MTVAHEWRAEVKELLRLYYFPQGEAEGLPPTACLTRGVLRKLNEALFTLPKQYRVVLAVLEGETFPSAWGGPKAWDPPSDMKHFPHWPKGRHKGLESHFRVSPRTIDDWHANALDQVAESLGLKDVAAYRSTPRRETQEPEYRPGRWPRPEWRDRVEERLERIGRYGFCISECDYALELRDAHHRIQTNHAQDRLMELGRGLPFFIDVPPVPDELYYPPDPNQQRADANALVHDVLTDPRLRNLILDRYWDRNCNHRTHPKNSVDFYAERLKVGRTRYYQLWNEALHTIAEYWQIPQEEDGPEFGE